MTNVNVTNVNIGTDSFLLTDSLAICAMWTDVCESWRCKKLFYVSCRQAHNTPVTADVTTQSQSRPSKITQPSGNISGALEGLTALFES